MGRIKSWLMRKVVSWDKKIIINVGINAINSEEANEQIKEIAGEIEVKLKTYLENFPYTITVK